MTRDEFLEKLYEVLDRPAPHQLTQELMDEMADNPEFQDLYTETLVAEQMLQESYTNGKTVSPRLHNRIMKSLENSTIHQPLVKSFPAKWIGLAAAILVIVSATSFFPLFLQEENRTAPQQVAHPLPKEVHSFSLSALFNADLFTPINKEILRQEILLEDTRTSISETTNSMVERTTVVLPTISAPSVNPSPDFNLFQSKEEQSNQNLNKRQKQESIT